MHIAQIQEWGDAPKYVQASDPPLPQTNEVQIKVIAVGIHNVVRSRASGKHYSTSKHPPHIPGVDGIGTTEDGRQVYFTTFAPSGGTLSEIVNLPSHSVFPISARLDPVQTAALVNPAMSSWLAVHARTKDLPKDFTVLIIGATSASGRVAIPLTRELGAKKVIGVARDVTRLKELDLDETITMSQHAAETDFSKLGDVDVVLDYVYGPVTEQLFKSLNSRRSVQYVEIGGLSGTPISLPAEVLRSKDITIRGSGPGAWSIQDSARALPSLLKALEDVPPQPLRTASMKDIETEWLREGEGRLVFTV